MKKVISALSIVIILVASASQATDRGRSRARKAAMAEAKCEVMVDAAKKEECLKELEEKSSRKDSSSEK